MRYFDAETVTALGPVATVEAITTALRDGLDPSADPPRTSVALASGEFLLMPSEIATGAGVKVVTVAPDNPPMGLARIQATYLLFDPDTLTLRAVLDGTALTTVRTPAVSVVAILSRLPDRPLRIVVVGDGPQAIAHLATLAAHRPIAAATYLVREPATGPDGAVRLGSAAADACLEAADVVVCATSARSPLFDSTVLRDEVVVVAVGSHQPDARELDAALLGRACVVVEDVHTALREAGDVVMAIDEGALTADDLITLRDVVTGTADVPTDRPLVFKSVGMSWQDLVVAEAVHDVFGAG